MSDGHFQEGAWPLAVPSVLLIVGGGIAAYKALEVTRLLRKAGVTVRPILTAAGAQFVTPLSLSALAEEEVRVDLFSLSDEGRMGHIELTRSADLVLVAPATADLMAKAAHGLADDLASTALLATDKPVMMAPAMNVRMWLHAATRRNLAILKADGVTIVGPDDGAMACGEFGPGRMAEPPIIFEAVMTALEARRGDKPLAGRHVLVTAGPTVEAIDPVRLLTNRSSGKQGYAIGAALAALGARVTLVSGPTALATPRGVDRINVESARDMLAACQSALPADAAVCVAAVSDWRPDTVFGVKLKKGKDGPPTLRLVENPDILASLAAARVRRGRVWWLVSPPRPTIWRTNARAKLTRKGCDWIVANDVSDAGDHGGRRQRGAAGDRAGVSRAGPRASKAMVARRLADRASPEALEVTTCHDDVMRRLDHAEGLPLPAYESPGAAGMDLRAAVAEDDPMVLRPGGRAAIPTGLAIALPDGFEAQVRPRSGMALAKGVVPLNTPGTIDSDYRGEVKVILINHGAEAVTIRRGDRIAQLLIAPVTRAEWSEVEVLDETRRGDGGFGSTGGR